jgi:hypothetical protein
MKILDMVLFLSHDLYILAVDSNAHHKTVTYPVLPLKQMIMVIKCTKLYDPEAYNGSIPILPTMLQ